MYKLHILFAIPLLFACTSAPEKTVELEDIMPKAKYDSQQKPDSITQIPTFQPSLGTTFLTDNGIVWDSIAINEELSVPERFGPKKIEKFNYYTNGATVEYYSWSFPDSTKSMKAFLNWMNCFGERCTMIELRQPVNIQRNAFLILQTDTSIIQLQTATAGLTELKKWKTLFTTNEKSKWNYIILQSKGGKSAWSSFLNEEETTLLPLNK